MKFSIPKNRGAINKPVRNLVATGLLFYVVFIIIYAPASLLAWAMEKAGISSFILQQPNGTVWHGHGLIATPAGSNQAAVITRVEWRIRPFHLLLGKLKTSLTFSDEALMGKATVSITPGTLLIDKLKLAAPASTVGLIYAPASLLSLSGNITVTANTFSLSRKQFLGTATLTWRDAGSALTPVNPLGNFEFGATSDKTGNKASIRGKNLDGPLVFSINGNWDIGGSQMLNLNGFIQPGERKQELEPLLRMIGNDNGGGRRNINLNMPMKLAR
ncbi:MAG: type II secretion system protein N [Gammaproteobacteria bacterium]|nr:type II secretion system protein N [Gammaproteobacteria bacterium]